jgi:hypothetical protein
MFPLLQWINQCDSLEFWRRSEIARLKKISRWSDRCDHWPYNTIGPVEPNIVVSWRIRLYDKYSNIVLFPNHKPIGC